MSKIIVSFILLAFSQITFAESSPLDFLYGKWEGFGTKGTVVRASSECNYSKLNGKIGIIEAKYIEVESQKVHLEFGVLSPLDNNGKYKFSMVREDGSALDGIAQVDGVNQVGVLTFVFPPAKPDASAMIAKYTVTVKDGHWLEIGEISTDDGQQWKKIYEMNLKKVADMCE